MARVERLAPRLSVSTRGNKLVQVGLITGLAVADGIGVMMLPEMSLTVIRSEAVGVETFCRVVTGPLKKRLKRCLATKEIIDRTRVRDDHLKMDALLLNGSPSSTGVGNEGGGGGGGGAPSISPTSFSSPVSTDLSTREIGPL